MADVTKNILFTIGTVGASGAASKMGALATKVGVAVVAFKSLEAIAQKVVNLFNESGEFIKVLDKSETSMAQFNKQTGGLIDTMESYRQMVRGQEGDLAITEERFAAIGAAASSAAQAMGEGGDGATTRFKNLMSAIMRGREGVLKEYGIDLSQTTDLQLAQAEAMDLLVQKYGDVEVKAETAKDAIYAFGNSVGTVMDFELAAATSGMNEFVVELLSSSDTLFQWEKDLEATGGKLAHFYSILDDGEVIMTANNETFQESIERGEDMYITQGRLIQQGIALTDGEYEKAKAYYEVAEAIKAATNAQREADEQARRTRAAQRGLSKTEADLEIASDILSSMDTASTSNEIDSLYRQMLKYVKKYPGVYDEFEITRIYQLERNLGWCRWWRSWRWQSYHANRPNRGLIGCPYWCG
jgi:hypothetical protein